MKNLPLHRHGGCISRDTQQQADIFPLQLPCLTRRHHFPGDICKNIFFTLSERTGARSFPARRARAHVTNVPWCDSESPCFLALSKTPGDSFLFLSSPHSRKLTAKGTFCPQESQTSLQINRLKSSSRNTRVNRVCSLPGNADCPLSPLSRLQPSHPVQDQALHVSWHIHI